MSNDTGDSSAHASGYRALMEKFETFFGLRLSYLVFGATEEVSKTLQGHDLNAQDASRSVSQAVSFLKRQPSDAAFSEFYQATMSKAENLTDPPKLSLPDAVIFTSPESYFRKQYFEVLDLLISELEGRFNQPCFSVLKEIESLLLSSSNDVTVQLPEKFSSFYGKDLDLDRLSIQLRMLPDLLKTAKSEHQLGVKKITSVSTIVQLFNTCPFSKTMLQQVDRLLRIFLTIPMASATAERSFSALRRLKNYLRTTMTQKRLNHLILMHVHKDKTDELDLSSIAREFVSANERRQNYFGSWE